MKFRLLFALLLLSTIVHAQSMFGIWRGYFFSGYGAFKQQYKYEVQLDELFNKSSQKAIQGVTYSYRTTVFYGKATLQGIYDAGSKTITIRETKLVELKIAERTEPCLMTCYLDYRKEGNTEILEGTFTSVNANTKGDCGSGYVYLERVQESDFQKEEFLTKKKKITPPKTNATTAPKTQPQAKPKTVTPAPPVAKKTTPPVKTTPKTSNNGTTKKTIPPATKTDTVVKVAPVKPPAVSKPQQDLPKKVIPVPDVIKERDNPLVKKITTTSTDILIELYDNGEIDGDTITVYDNNEVIAYRKKLNKSPISLHINATADNPHHEIVMVANNLGSIPPNTALMVVTTEGKHYEMFISSDEKKNAKVVIDYKEPATELK